MHVSRPPAVSQCTLPMFSVHEDTVQPKCRKFLLYLFSLQKKKLIGILHYPIQYFPSESIFVNKHQEGNRNRFLLNFLSIHLIIKYTIYIQHCDRYSTLFVVKTISVPKFDTNLKAITNRHSQTDTFK